jgi:endonuclease/exonuclease/phosphatase family metal-dependent hydrolase
LTWNSEGEKTAEITALLKKYNPDVMLIQEAGSLGLAPGNYTNSNIYPAQSISGYTCFVCPWDRSGDGEFVKKGATRCSMAILTNPHHFQGIPTVHGCSEDKKRPVITLKIRGLEVMNIHAGGIDYIKEALDMMATRGGKWAIAGDFNKTPEDMHEIIDGGIQCSVNNPNSATRWSSQREIDYCVSSINGDAEIIPLLGSDHLPVFISIPI